MTTKAIALIVLITPLFSFANPEPVVVEKTNLILGDEVFDARYIEYAEPIEYKKWKPVEGEQPDWAKSEQISDEWYLYSYDEVTNCISPFSLKMNGITSEEALAKAKKEYAEIPKDQLSKVLLRHLVSELYLKNEDHEYLYVTFQLPTSGAKSFVSTSAWLEKVNGTWMDITCDTMSYAWVREFLFRKKEIFVQLKEK